MTREEAIKVMFYAKNYFWNDTEVNSALDMAIEALEAHPTLDDVSNAYENGYRQGKFEALSDAPDTNVGKWIPCSERLPKMDGKYLITEVDGYVTCDYFRLENGDWRTTFWRYPIAWMPLPEPYKENES